MTSALTQRSNQTEQALRQLNRVLPDGAIVTDREILEAYGGDESEADPVTPEALIRVQRPEDAVAIMEAANRHRVPVTPRGAGTGRTGGAVPVDKGIVLTFEQCAGIKDISRDDLVAVVEPGLILAQLHEAVEAEGLFYPPDPNSLASCTLGGNAAENAAGPRTLRYGPTRDYVLGMEVVTATGQRLRVGKQTHKGVTGYDLTSLLVGSEGTLALTTELTLKLIPKPEAIVTLMVFLPDLTTTGQAVGAALGQGFLPRCIEMMDDVTLDLLRPTTGLVIPSQAQTMLIVELDGDSRMLEDHLERYGNVMDGAGATEILVARHGGEREKLWAARRELSYAMRRSARFKLAEDVVVPRSRIPDLLGICRTISETEQVHMPSYGHAGDGNIHVNFLWSDEQEKPQVNRAVERLFRAVVDLGGTLSGEHGIGLLKAPYLSLELSDEQIALQKQLKNLFDPHSVLNPGKIFPRGHRAC